MLQIVPMIMDFPSKRIKVMTYTSKSIGCLQNLPTRRLQHYEEPNPNPSPRSRKVAITGDNIWASFGNVGYKSVPRTNQLKLKSATVSEAGLFRTVEKNCTTLLRDNPATMELHHKGNARVFGFPDNPSSQER